MRESATMLVNALRLMRRGRLFRDNAQVARRWALGTLLTAGAVIGLSLAGLAPGLAAILGAAFGGALQPWLLRDLKYA